MGGVASTGQGPSGKDTPLTPAPFSPISITTLGGTINAVVYEGNVLLINSSDALSMTGFGTVPAGATAKASWVVADGQCGAISPNGCFSTTPTAGSGDTLAFQATSPLAGPTFNDGPDAFKGRGSDHANVYDPGAGCPWGIPAGGGDTCLWDTRNFDVSAFTPAGTTSVTATATSAPLDGTDCLEDEARVFAVGPSAAWATGGYVASGKGLRDQGSGSITITGIPPGSAVQKALLYWNILNTGNPGNAMKINGNSAPGTVVGTDGSPCWSPATSFAFRADVTPFVSGNGSFTLSGYPTGETDGVSPWISTEQPPEMEGASLIVFYGPTSTPGKVTGGGTIDPITGNPTGMASMLIKSGTNAGIGSTANFGFVVMFNAGNPAPTGNLEYQDHAMNLDIKAISFNLLLIGDAGTCPSVPNSHATFTGQASVNGGRGQFFRVDVDDCSPGSAQPDDFTIAVPTQPYAASGPLVGGDIVIHKSS
jgi:hypothetical protein